MTLREFFIFFRSTFIVRPENITIYKMQLYYNSILYRKLRSEDDLSLLSDLEEYNLAFLAYEKILDEKYEFADNFSFKNRLDIHTYIALVLGLVNLCWE